MLYCREIDFERFVADVLSCQMSDGEGEGVYHQGKTTIIYHLTKYHDMIYITIFYAININYI